MNDRINCYDLSGAILPLHYFRKAQQAKEKMGSARALRVIRVGEDAGEPYSRRVVVSPSK